MTRARLRLLLDIREDATARNLDASRNTVNAIRFVFLFPSESESFSYFVVGWLLSFRSVQGGVGCSINCRCEGCKNAFGRKDGEHFVDY